MSWSLFSATEYDDLDTEETRHKNFVMYRQTNLAVAWFHSIISAVWATGLLVKYREAVFYTPDGSVCKSLLRQYTKS